MRAFLGRQFSPSQAGGVIGPFPTLARTTNVGEPISLRACIILVKDSGGRERKPLD